MKNSQKSRTNNSIYQTATCVGLSLFYFALLAYPFGVTAEGFMVERMLIAGVVFFAISIPAWIINVRRELFSTEEEKAVASEENTVKKLYTSDDIGQLALENNWITPKELKQILFCQECDGRKFGEVAVKRNFLTMSQVKSLLQMQSEQRHAVEIDS